MIPPTDTATQAGPGINAASKAAITANADFATFLKMLTTQMRNQDPLNPIESSDFAVQLATFSGVEQQAHTNKLLGEINAQQQSSLLGQTVGWIGKEAKTTAPVWFGKQALSLQIEPTPLADDVALVAVNDNGEVASRELIGPGAGRVDWIGRDDSGEKLPDGNYTFRIESLRNGVVIGKNTVGVFALIKGTQTSPSGVEVILSNGSTVPVSDVSLLQEPA